MINFLSSHVSILRVNTDRDNALLQLQFSTVSFSINHENKTINEGDIIIESNETLIIENCFFNQTGNIIVKDNATLVIRNATLLICKPDPYAFNIGALNSRIYVENSNVTSMGAGGSSLISIINSTIDEGVSFGDYTSVLVKDTILKTGIDCRGANITIERSTVGGIMVLWGWYMDWYCYPSIKIINSTISSIEQQSGWLSITDSKISEIKSYSNVIIISSNVSRLKAQWNLNWGMPNVTTGNQIVTVWLINSRIDSIEILGEASVYRGWYLTITVTLDDIPQESSNVEVYDKNGTLIMQATTNKDGMALFLLPEMITWPGMNMEYLGDYIIKASYNGIMGQDEITLNGNKQVQINLVTQQSIPFHETPLGIATIFGTAMAIIVMVLVWRRKSTIKLVGENNARSIKIER